MNSLLGELDSEIPMTNSSVKRRTREEPARKARRLSPPIKGKRRVPHRAHEDVKPDVPSSPPPMGEFDTDDDEYGPPIGDDDIQMNDAPIPPSSPAAAASRRKQVIFKKEDEDDDDDDLAVAEIKGNKGVRSEAVNISASRSSLMSVPEHKPAPITPRKSANIDSSAWANLAGSLNIVSSPQVEKANYGKLAAEDVVEEDGSLKMYWMDYTEVNGSLCLFGKVMDKRSNKYVSAFLKVDGILRNLFFLPRETRQSESAPQKILDELLLTILQNLGAILEVNQAKWSPWLTSTKKPPA